jgi:hypothetical protein
MDLIMSLHIVGVFLFCSLWIILIRAVLVVDYRLRLMRKNYKAYENLSSYNKMVFSFKPLKDKYWVK